ALWTASTRKNRYIGVQFEALIVLELELVLELDFEGRKLLDGASVNRDSASSEIFLGVSGSFSCQSRTRTRTRTIEKHRKNKCSNIYDLRYNDSMERTF